MTVSPYQHTCKYALAHAAMDTGAPAFLTLLEGAGELPAYRPDTGNLRVMSHMTLLLSLRGYAQRVSRQGNWRATRESCGGRFIGDRRLFLGLGFPRHQILDKRPNGLFYSVINVWLRHQVHQLIFERLLCLMPLAVSSVL